MVSGPAAGSPRAAASWACPPHSQSSAFHPRTWAKAVGSSLFRGRRRRRTGDTARQAAAGASGGKPPRSRAISTARRSPPSSSTSPRSSGVGSRPHPAARHLVDGVASHSAAGGDLVGEIVVDEIEPLVELGPLVLAEAGLRREHQGVAPVGETFDVHPEALEQTAGLELAAEHPDRAREGRRLRHDDVGGHGHEVPTRTGHVAHRDDDGLAGLASDAHLPPDGVRSDIRATGAVDPKHDRLYALVSYGGAECRGDGV